LCLTVVPIVERAGVFYSRQMIDAELLLTFARIGEDCKTSLAYRTPLRLGLLSIGHLDLILILVAFKVYKLPINFIGESI
jgi:hypothetical protein